MVLRRLQPSADRTRPHGDAGERAEPGRGLERHRRSKDQIQFITANIDGADRQQSPHARRVQQQLGKAQELAGRSRTVSIPTAPTTRRRPSSRTGRSRATLDWVPSQKFVVGMRGGYFKTDLARYERHRTNRATPGPPRTTSASWTCPRRCSTGPASPASRRTLVAAGSIHPRVLPRRRDRVLERRRRAPGEVRHAVRPHRQQGIQRRATSARDSPLGLRPCLRHRSTPAVAAPTATTRCAARQPTRRTASLRRATSTVTTSASSSRMRGRSTTS